MNPLAKFRRTALTPQQRDLLSQLRADNAVAAATYRPGTGEGKGWDKLVAEFEATFRSEGIGDVEQQS
jgi:hypothetical protein